MQSSRYDPTNLKGTAMTTEPKNVGAHPSKFEIEMLSVNLADNLNAKFWMDYFTKWREADFVEATMGVSCHPEGWEYACLCRECQESA